MFGKLLQIKTHTFGAHSFAFRGSILWNALNGDMKICKNFAASKKKVNTWKGQTAVVNYVVIETLYFYLILCEYV